MTEKRKVGHDVFDCGNAIIQIHQFIHHCKFGNGVPNIKTYPTPANTAAFLKVVCTDVSSCLGFE